MIRRYEVNINFVQSIFSRMNKVVLLLGGNQGDRFELLRKAEKLLNNNIGFIVSKSSIYESEPWGFNDENYFLNQIVVVQTEKAALEILSIIHSIENFCGRVRNGNQWEPRTMDIDILFFNDEIIKTKELTIPHVQIPNRLFTIIPLAEIDSGFVHPELQVNMNELLRKCKDKSVVKLFDTGE